MTLAQWTKQDQEWAKIGREMAHASPGKIITAYDVSQEQKRRAEQRGEHLLTFDEINAYGKEAVRAPTERT